MTLHLSRPMAAWRMGDTLQSMHRRARYRRGGTATITFMAKPREPVTVWARGVRTAVIE